jgi:hypothetical protein
LAIAVRAVAGPFDLGTVVVRQAAFVDPRTADIRVPSDPLPTIIEGIPLRVRSVRVNVDRPGFIVTPTSCAEKRLAAQLHSQQGSTAAVSTRFQATECHALPFKPAMSMRLTGRTETKVGRHPGLHVTMKERRGHANLRQLAVHLPLSLALDPANANALCEYDDGQAVRCPKASIIGSVKAVSPLLPKPLAGPVYFVKGVRFGKDGRRIRTLPTLLMTLRGDIAIDVRASASVKDKKLVSTFTGLPDAALSRVDVSLKGGKGGILTVTGSKSLCAGRQVADVKMDGHNGRRADRLTPMATPCK